MKKRVPDWAGSSVTAHFILLLLILLFLSIAPAEAEDNHDNKALAVIAEAIQAMGGDNYRQVENSKSEGRYFHFRKGRKSFASYVDWTVYQPVKSRLQFGEGERSTVYIYNLDVNQGWVLEGESEVEEVEKDQIQNFRRAVKKDINILLRDRVDEEGMSLFYYGPDDIAGTGEYEAVEFVDATNDSVVVFFDRDTHLPSKLETHETDKEGVRHKEETEFSNWHVIDGVKTPLRIDNLVDGEMSSQNFIESITYNQDFAPDLFLEPVIKD